MPLSHPHAHDREKQIVLALKVVIQRGFMNRNGVRDFLHGDGVVPVLDEQWTGGPKDANPAIRPCIAVEIYFFMFIFTMTHTDFDTSFRAEYSPASRDQPTGWLVTHS
jgi:hypothetical protein